MSINEFKRLVSGLLCDSGLHLARVQAFDECSENLRVACRYPNPIQLVRSIWHRYNSVNPCPIEWSHYRLWHNFLGDLKTLLDLYDGQRT